MSISLNTDLQCVIIYSKNEIKYFGKNNNIIFTPGALIWTNICTMFKTTYCLLSKLSVYGMWMLAVALKCCSKKPSVKNTWKIMLEIWWLLQPGDSYTGVHLTILLICYVFKNSDKVYQTKSI